MVGKALGADAKAAELSAKVDADLTAAQALTAGVTTRKLVLFILSMQGGTSERQPHRGERHHPTLPARRTRWKVFRASNT